MNPRRVVHRTRLPAAQLPGRNGTVDPRRSNRLGLRWEPGELRPAGPSAAGDDDIGAALRTVRADHHRSGSRSWRRHPRRLPPGLDHSLPRSTPLAAEPVPGGSDPTTTGGTPEGTSLH